MKDGVLKDDGGFEEVTDKAAIDSSIKRPAAEARDMMPPITLPT